MLRPATTRQSGRPRRAAVLLIVLVVIVLLALGAYTFCETMISEREAAAMFGRKVRTRAFADSGVEYAAAVLGRKTERPFENYYDRPELFRDVLLLESERARGRGRFSIVAAHQPDAAPGRVRYGMTDESGKLNVNMLPRWIRKERLDEEQARAFLIHLPNMTHSIADAILDRLDDDELPRRYGAESEFYEQLESPYQSKNGPVDSLDELLLVRGVTPALLFGEDDNRNGLLDENEDDGDASPPPDNADGQLNRGWAEYLTVYSRESNLRSDGRRRINLNQRSLAQLFEELTLEFGDDTAALIVGLRRRAEDVPPSDAPDSGGGTDAVPQDGTSGAPGGNRIGSIYDLIDAEVTTTEGAGGTRSTPWTKDPNQLRRVLPKLLDTLTVHGTPYIEGRVNINIAPRDVLLGVPGVTEALADTIVGRQAILTTGQASTSVLAERATTAWLLIEGLVDLPQMRQLDKYITGRGDVYRIQSLGYFDAGGPATRLEAVIDATRQPPQVVLLRDLTVLGRGY